MKAKHHPNYASSCEEETIAWNLKVKKKELFLVPSFLVKLDKILVSKCLKPTPSDMQRFAFLFSCA